MKNDPELRQLAVILTVLIGGLFLLISLGEAQDSDRFTKSTEGCYLRTVTEKSVWWFFEPDKVERTIYCPVSR